MDKLNPHDLQSYISLTSLSWMDAQQEYKLAKEIHLTVQDWFPYVSERPRWAAWYDQINRSSMSVCLNYAEAIGKGKGWTMNSILVARAEAYETAAALAIGPKDLVQTLRSKILELVSVLNERIQHIEEKPDPMSRWNRS